jgi:hypothetical protein
MDRKRLVEILPWIASIRFVPGLAVIAYAVDGLIEALVYGHAEFCVGPKYHMICNVVTAAQYPELHWQIQMDWIYLALGFALLFVGWFVPRNDNGASKGR